MIKNIAACWWSKLELWLQEDLGSTVNFIHSFIQQGCIKCALHVRRCCKLGGYNKEQDKVSSLVLLL